MKKTSIALLMGLFAVGCGANPPAKPPTPPADPQAMMKTQHSTMPSAPGDKKDGDAVAPAVDGDKPAAEGDKPAEDKKEADAPAKPE